MKMKGQELALLGLQEINESEKNEIAGGLIPTLKDFIIVCCYDIPPSRSTGDYI